MTVQAEFDPMFIPDDTAARIVGVFADSGLPAAACKRLDDSTAWIFSLPPLETNLLRELFRTAGAHIYCDGGETVLAGSGLVVVTAVEGETLALRLRSGKVVTTVLPPMTTAIFDAETGEMI